MSFTKTSTSNLSGKLSGKSIGMGSKGQPWYMNKVFLGSALFAPVGGLIGIVAAKSLDDNSPLSTEGKTATTIAVDKPEETIAVAGAPAENAANIIPETESEEMHINFISDLPCGHPSDNLSFGEAFREQRNILGQGGVFEYQGKYYNTYYKEEWDAMTDEQKNEYFLSIDSKIDYSKSFITGHHKGNQYEVSVQDFNQSAFSNHNSPFIPEDQAEGYVPFEYGHTPMEAGPNAIHLQPDFEVPSTVIVDDYDFNSGSHSFNGEIDHSYFNYDNSIGLNDDLELQASIVGSDDSILDVEPGDLAHHFDYNQYGNSDGAGHETLYFDHDVDTPDSLDENGHHEHGYTFPDDF